MAAAVHLLRGDQERADELEQRLGAAPTAAFQQMVAHALIGRGEPELALDRVRHLSQLGPKALAVRAEALALLGRWDELDVTFGHLAELPGVEELPRVMAQLDRVRGIAGDERALERSTALFARLGCRFEHARCLELGGDLAGARSSLRADGRDPGPHPDRGLTVFTIVPESAPSKPGVSRMPNTTAIIETSKGTIELELYADDAPETVANFTKLAADGYYDGLIFHRVIPDFMIQGGCPEGTGTGGPGYNFKDEINHHRIVKGTLAMANAGPNTNGSQFFIVTADATPWLDGKHTAFGQVTSGQDVVDAIQSVDRDGRDRPVEPITMDKVTVSSE